MRAKLLIAFCLVLSLFIISSRIYFRFPFLYSWDSVNFALSIKEFDVIKHQPHPPGYILYSALLRIVNPFLNDPNKTMIGINIAAAVIASIFLAMLMLELIPTVSSSMKLLLACGAAALYATNPIHWFYGSLAEIYPLEGCLAAVTVYFLVVSLRRPSLVPWLGIVLGIVGGIRLTTEVFLLPAYIYILLKSDKKTKITSAICIVIANLIWFVPLVYLSHGLKSYLNAVFNQLGREPSRTAGFHVEVLFDLITALIQIITLPVLSFSLRRMNKIRFDQRLDVLILSIIPALLFFAFMHYTKRGYLMVVVPTLIAFAMYLLHNSIQKFRSLLPVIVLGILTNVLVFLIPPALNAKQAERHWTKKLIYQLTYPNRHIRNDDEAKFGSFFNSMSAFADKKKLFVIQHGYFPEWRTVMYYFADDTAMVLLPRKRATVAENFKVRKVRQPFHLNGDERLMILIGPQPVLPLFRSFKAGDHTYYYGYLRHFPYGFRVYEFQFFKAEK
ncbi:MAG TPA: DUF2723 domain-containing protein [Acidobacteriota bacterium]|nr:DUF2723 domain-containing protein [Acidobacteriota bacterium]